MKNSNESDTEMQRFGYIATVGELRDVCETVIDKHSKSVEVTVRQADGFCVPPSPVLMPPKEWDEYDDGTLTVVTQND